MANSYNSLPIRIDSPFTSWRNGQTLNVGTVPGYPFPRQPGPQVYRIVWKNPGASASFSVADPIDGTILFDGTTPAAFAGSDPYWEFSPPLQWRDFSVTTISSGVLEIWRRP